MSGTTNTNYEMRAPRRGRSGISADAWAPSQLELLTQQQIAQTDGSQMLGYQLNARTRQQNSADAYATLANSMSQRQTQSDDLEARLTAAARIADARNPELAVAFTDVRNMIDPRFQETMDQLPEILPARQTSEANFNNARANAANAEAGVLPPQGSTVDRYSLPTAPRRQGATEAQQRAAAGGGSGVPNINQELARERLIQGVQASIPTATQQNLRAFITGSGYQAVVDAGGNAVRPPGMSEAQFNAHVTRARLQAEHDARMRLEGMDQRTGRRFGFTAGAGMPTGAPPAAAAPAPEAAPAAPAPQVPRGPGPQPAAAPAAAATPAAAARVAPNQVSPDRMTQINAVAPPQPGTRRVLVGNEVVYIDAAGAVQRRVPVQ